MPAYSRTPNVGGYAQSMSAGSLQLRRPLSSDVCRERYSFCGKDDDRRNTLLQPLHTLLPGILEFLKLVGQRTLGADVPLVTCLRVSQSWLLSECKLNLRDLRASASGT